MKAVPSKPAQTTHGIPPPAQPVHAQVPINAKTKNVTVDSGVPEIPFSNARITNGRRTRYAVTTKHAQETSALPTNLPTDMLKLNTPRAAAPIVPTMTTAPISMPSF